MNFLPAERRERHQFVDTTVSSMHSLVMGSRAIREVLGEGVVAQLDHLAANYTVPNKRDNTYYPTKAQQRRDTQFIVPVRSDELFRPSPDFAWFSAAQREQIASGLHDSIDTEGQSTEEWIAETLDAMRDLYLRERAYMSLEGNSAYAQVDSQTIQLTDMDDPEGYYIAEGAPTLYLRHDSEVHPEIFLHELVHLWQVHRSPISFIDGDPHAVGRRVLALEREAYVKQAALAETGELPAPLKRELELILMHHRLELRAIEEFFADPAHKTMDADTYVDAWFDAYYAANAS